MSRKRNRGRTADARRTPVRNQAAQKTERLESANNVLKTLVSQDGYVNQLAHLGEGSDLQDANDFERHSISRDYELLTVMYRENWIAKRIIDTPCEDMTRSWYSVVSEIGQDKLDELKQLEAKHNIKQEITNGLRWARLYGGAAAVMVIKGQEDMLDEPLNYDDLMPGCFRGLIIVDRTSGLDPSPEVEEDMDDPEFGYPKYYNVRLSADNSEVVRIHHSRMLFFRGRMLPLMEEVTENYWGASEFEHIYEELQKRNATSANIAQLVFQANVSALKMADYGEILGMGTEKQKRQILENLYLQNRMRTSFGLMLMGNEDSYEQHPYSFSGLSEVYETFMMDMAGAAEIPATKLFGRSPQGMNATGESDLKNYYEMLAQLQERNLRPVIEKLIPIMAINLWGEVPEDFEVVFEPLQVTTPAERASIMQQVTSVVIQAYSAGLIGQKPALIELQKFGKDIGFWDSITDEMIEKANEEVDNGEGDPMGGMGGMGGMMPGGPGGGAPGGGMPPEGGPGGGMPPEMMPPEEEPPQEAQNEPEQASGAPEDELLAKIEKAAKEDEEAEKQQAQEEEKEDAEDGGVGSGNFNHPGYRRGGGLAPQKPEPQGRQKAGIASRVAFMANPASALPENVTRKGTAAGPTGSKAQVEKNNREREEWSNLTMRQRIKGNSEQQRHIAKMKSEVLKAAAKGDIEKAKQIVRQNRQYWSNDPDSAMKVQSETLKRQKAVKPRRSLREIIGGLFRPRKSEKGAGDMSVRGTMIKAYAKDHTNDEVADFILKLYNVDSEVWRSTEEGNHFKFETSTGEIKQGFGGKFTGKKIGEQWSPNSGSRQRKAGGKVAAPQRVEPRKIAQKIPLTFHNGPYGMPRSKSMAEGMEKEFESTKKETENVFRNPNSTSEEKADAMNNLLQKAEMSDTWNDAKNGKIRTTSEYGIMKVPKEWEQRLEPNEREVLANLAKEQEENEHWEDDNKDANDLLNTLQAKLLGAEVDVQLSPEILEKYAGIEQRVETPGQQSMFWGENVPGENPQNSSSAPVAKEPGIHYNVGGPMPEFAKAPAKSFLETFHAAKKEVEKIRPQDSWRVDDTYSEKDYEKMECFTTKGGSSFAIHDGDIVSVCVNPNDNVRGSQLIQKAFELGGNKLDAFGGLYGFYIRNGLEPVSWCEFADVEGIRPHDWDRTRDEKEPVIFFKKTTKTREQIMSEYGKDQYEYVKRVKASMDYDTAKMVRNESMEG